MCYRIWLQTPPDHLHLVSLCICGILPILVWGNQFYKMCVCVCVRCVCVCVWSFWGEISCPWKQLLSSGISWVGRQRFLNKCCCCCVCVHVRVCVCACVCFNLLSFLLWKGNCSHMPARGLSATPFSSCSRHTPHIEHTFLCSLCDDVLIPDFWRKSHNSTINFDKYPANDILSIWPGGSFPLHTGSVLF